MTNKHTPGPWITSQSHGHRYVRRNGANVGELAVCKVMTGRQWDEVDANAKLIAAAPETKAQRDELLAACKGLLKQYGHDEIDAFNLALTRAEAAITKAERKV